MSSPSFAVGLFYEGFNYTPTAPLNGNGGWIDPAGATYPGLTTWGYKAEGSGTYGNASSGNGSMAAVKTAMDAGNSIYFTLLNRTSDDTSDANGTGSRIFFKDTSNDLIMYGGLRRNGNVDFETHKGAVLSGSPSIGLATLGMIALKFEINTSGNDTVYVGVNPTLPGEPTWSAGYALEINNVDEIGIDNNRGTGNNTGCIMDEIRFATTWSEAISWPSVAPPPLSSDSRDRKTNHHSLNFRKGHDDHGRAS